MKQRQVEVDGSGCIGIVDTLRQPLVLIVVFNYTFFNSTLTVMPADVTIPNGSVSSATVPSTPITATGAPVAPSAPPPEIEATLSRLSAYRNVRGVMILARAGGTGSGIIQSTGSVFEGESGRKYAGSLEAVVAATAGAVSAVDEGVSVCWWRRADFEGRAEADEDTDKASRAHHHPRYVVKSSSRN